MTSPQISQTCAEHKVEEADRDNKYHKAKRLQRAQWLRAAILGASDGLISTTSLMLGVGTAEEDGRSMVLSGLAGALAGAFSMAVGEFVSVSTQRDIEKATVSYSGSKDSEHNDLAIKLDITATPPSIDEETRLGETNLTVTPLENIQHGTESIEKASPSVVEPTLPSTVTPGRSPTPTIKLLKEDARGSSGTSHDDNGEEVLITNPYKAAAASALAFLCGSSVPLLPAILLTQNVIRMVVIAVVTSIALALFGSLGAFLGGSAVTTSAVRVLVGGWIAMAITYGLLKPFDSDDKGSNATE
ncbi:hypothetical protein P3X46_029047 [Hevea brasiliensis]|uniref:Vacuolar iron transporter n=1 Tax=Hevea brasiliensis TaxID=3981 RepID=A0ABQ9KU31_HEVBR|nr:vacuolar iron transporter homolog 2.1-like [Hevea brasiliensis]KAJ9146823.1 hypothetical protein P3X46_029047 [Hevea brasiliensis]